MEVVGVWELLLHFVQIASQEVFSRKVEHGWKMVDFLMRPHPRQSLRGYDIVSPSKIPVRIAILGGFKPQIFGDLLEHCILAILMEVLLPAILTMRGAT